VALTGPTIERLRAHVEELASGIGERHLLRPRALDAAAEYVAGAWGSFGYEVATERYEVGGTRCANLHAERRGAARPERILLLGAHYDTVPGCPGANDNASGVAALLEISRRFAVLAPRTTVRFVAFVNEEPPYFPGTAMGSRVCARTARVRGDDIRLMVSLETLGYYSSVPGSQTYPPLFRLFYPDRGEFVAVVSNLRSRRAMLGFVEAFRAGSDFPVEHVATLSVVPGVSWSDHRSFWKEGYRALMVTDTAFYRYPYYHTAFDTADRLAYAAFARVVEGLHGAVATLAGVSAPVGPPSPRPEAPRSSAPGR
jgi:hypothetical protein